LVERRQRRLVTPLREELFTAFVRLASELLLFYLRSNAVRSDPRPIRRSRISRRSRKYETS
jgi:hypothetical protein